ncbi:class I SAM-dependent methyltransferase [bacterium]|nr:class I SAM-dependent methyltransferase [bacterium]
MTEDQIWAGAYKIPWNDPDFSRRMLKEHLTQDHDMASRRLDWIERQVAWIHRELLAEKASRVLDLGCGPGLYSRRLSELGHTVQGIDFGPASIEYAQQNNSHPSRCEFILGDIRESAFGGPHDLVMLLFGEMNVFSPAEIRAILVKARKSLDPAGGQLIAEAQTFASTYDSGHADASEYEAESGLFSDRPHRCRTVSHWFADAGVAMQEFTITDRESGEEEHFRSTTKAWKTEEFEALFAEAGFARAAPREDWPTNTDCLQLWHAELT